VRVRIRLKVHVPDCARKAQERVPDGHGYYPSTMRTLREPQIKVKTPRSQMAGRGGSEERRYAGPTGPHLLGQSPLWRELDLQLTAEELTLELLVPPRKDATAPRSCLPSNNPGVLLMACHR